MPITRPRTMPNNNRKNNHTVNGFPLRRIQFGLVTAVGGFLIFMVGIKPEYFGLDRSPVIGFVQIAVMLTGLALVCIGGTTALRGLWKGRRPSIAAEIGIRIIATGYIIAVFSGLADIFGLGSHPYPEFTPYFGDWQARGVQIAEGFIAVGFLMMIPYTRNPLFRSRPQEAKPKKQNS